MNFYVPFYQDLRYRKDYLNMFSQFNPLYIFFHWHISPNTDKLMHSFTMKYFYANPHYLENVNFLRSVKKVAGDKPEKTKNHAIVKFRNVSVHLTSLAKNMCFEGVEILRIKTACLLTHAFSERAARGSSLHEE